MSGIASVRLNSFRKAWPLVGVYLLHLVFFQVLMQAAPSHNIDNTFRPLFTHHAQSNNSHHSHHPAVTYYSMMVKQGNDFGRVCDRIDPVVNQLEVVLLPSTSISRASYQFYQAGLIRLHWADDTFKLYRYIQVFLI